MSDIRIDIRENGQVTVLESGDEGQDSTVLYEKPPPPPPPEPVAETYMVVDVKPSKEIRSRFCGRFGWHVKQKDVMGESLRWATGMVRANSAYIIASCRPDVQFVVVVYDVNPSGACGGYDLIRHARDGAGWYRGSLHDLVKGEMSEIMDKAFTHDLEGAIEECQKIQALEDRNLVDVHVVCLDMLRDGGAE